MFIGKVLTPPKYWVAVPEMTSNLGTKIRFLYISHKSNALLKHIHGNEG